MTKEFYELWAKTAIIVLLAVIILALSVYLIIQLFGPWSPFVVMLLFLIGLFSFFIADELYRKQQ